MSRPPKHPVWLKLFRLLGWSLGLGWILVGLAGLPVLDVESDAYGYPSGDLEEALTLTRPGSDQPRQAKIKLRGDPEIYELDSALVRDHLDALQALSAGSSLELTTVGDQSLFLLTFINPDFPRKVLAVQDPAAGPIVSLEEGQRHLQSLGWVSLACLFLGIGLSWFLYQTRTPAAGQGSSGSRGRSMHRLLGWFCALTWILFGLIFIQASFPHEPEELEQRQGALMKPMKISKDEYGSPTGARFQLEGSSTTYGIPGRFIKQDLALLEGLEAGRSMELEVLLPEHRSWSEALIARRHQVQSLRLMSGEQIVSREDSLGWNRAGMAAGFCFQLMGWGLLLWMHDLLPSRSKRRRAASHEQGFQSPPEPRG